MITIESQSQNQKIQTKYWRIAIFIVMSEIVELIGNFA